MGRDRDRERGREREGETERDSKRQRQGERQRDRDRERDRDRVRDRNRERDSDRERDRERDSETAPRCPGRAEVPPPPPALGGSDLPRWEPQSGQGGPRWGGHDREVEAPLRFAGAGGADIWCMIKCE
ncbi:unnamed protein product [Nyctereutes procyonoides]|uniref:(raccoon dog) hypothetical protein n=1 Tax=Nyctereutes procyonoides TaxID=34880 RepID=A0A811YNA5_NYCPR|nr:unnamed protein product [Nyctereutes procyonoides]